MEMVVFVGEDKENWGQVSALVNRAEAEKILLVVQKGVTGFPSNEKCGILEFDSSLPLLELKSKMHANLKKELSGEFEVFLSIASGNGKEHMALIGALLSIPVGIKIVAYTKNGIEFIT